MSNFAQCLEMGRTAEDEWAGILMNRGWLVDPVYTAIGNTDGTRAPMLLHAGDKLISPDIVAFRGGEAAWWEVKAKKEPSWYRKYGRWEHGIDLRNWVDYRAVQHITGFPVFVAIREDLTPANPSSPGGLTPSVTWLYASLDDIRYHGENRPKWQNGGWLWPRSIMRVI